MNPGDRIYFGRTHGEKTLGTVIKVNRTTVKVKQLENRGSFRDYPIGTVWKVPFALCSPAEGGPPAIVARPVTPVIPARPQGSRPDAEVMKDILRVYCNLSPENLSCDGELPMSQVRRRAASLRAELKRLFQEIGRTVSEDEAYRSDRSAASGF